MARTVPLVADDGWPYPDGTPEPSVDDGIDLDVLELRADPHLYDSLTDRERSVLLHRFGLLDGRARPMKELAHDHDLTHAEVREVLETALSKVRKKLEALDDT